jgi:hypothetical protein
VALQVEKPVSDPQRPKPSPFRLRHYDVVSVSPVNDPLRLTGASVMADSEGDAFCYLADAGGWREAKDLNLLHARYQLVERDSAPAFEGTQSQWIQAVRVGYMPKAVRFSERALTQARLDKRLEVENERLDSLILKASMPNAWDHLRRWYRDQRCHPMRWRFIGLVAAGISAWVFWNMIFSVVISAFLWYLIWRWIRDL